MENNTVTNPSQQPSVPQNSPHLSKTFIIPILVVLIAVVGAGGYFLGANQNQVAQNQPQPIIPITQPSPIPTVDSSITANWKTYIGNQNNFSFKYPSDWYVDEFPGYISIQNFYSLSGRDQVKDKGKYKIAITEFGKNSKTINELKTQLMLYYNSLNQRIIDIKEVIINGNAALYAEIDQSIDQSTDPPYITVYILDGNGTVVGLSQEIDIEGGKSYFDQILSTFKFTQ